MPVQMKNLRDYAKHPGGMRVIVRMVMIMRVVVIMWVIVVWMGVSISHCCTRNTNRKCLILAVNCPYNGLLQKLARR